MATPHTFRFCYLDVVEIDLVPILVPFAFFSPGQDSVEVWLQSYLRRFIPRAEAKGESSSLKHSPCTAAVSERYRNARMSESRTGFGGLYV